MTPEAVDEILTRLQQARVAVVGDVMIDRFIWGKVARISPEAPVPVVEVDRSRELDGYRLGGAANVANNIVSLGARASLFGVLGDDDAARQCWRLLASRGIDGRGLQVVPGRPTTLKTRVVAHGQQVVRIDVEERSPLPDAVSQAMIEALVAGLGDVQAVILSDYAKGVLSPGFTQHLIERLKAAGRWVAVDPKVRNISMFTGASVVTPNRMEACLAAGVSADEPDAPLKAARILLERLGCEAVLVTLGEDGMLLVSRSGETFSVPTLAAEVYDVTGAGDTVIAVLVMGRAVGLSWHDSVLVANVAAGVAVGKVGTAVVSRTELGNALLSAGKKWAR